jgi:hypothetical protein
MILLAGDHLEVAVLTPFSRRALSRYLPLPLNVLALNVPRLAI